MSAENLTYTPEQIDFLQRAFDILVETQAPATEAEREEIARSVIFAARRGIADVEALIKVLDGRR